MYQVLEGCSDFIEYCSAGFLFPLGGKTVYVLVGEQQRNEAADAHAAAGKMLKKITFPEMDDDALPSWVDGLQGRLLENHRLSTPKLERPSRPSVTFWSALCPKSAISSP